MVRSKLGHGTPLTSLKKVAIESPSMIPEPERGGNNTKGKARDLMSRIQSSRIIYTRSPPWWMPTKYCWCLASLQTGMFICGVFFHTLLLAGTGVLRLNKHFLHEDIFVALIVLAMLIGILGLLLELSVTCEWPLLVLVTFCLDALVFILSLGLLSATLFSFAHLEGMTFLIDSEYGGSVKGPAWAYCHITPDNDQVLEAKRMCLRKRLIDLIALFVPCVVHSFFTSINIFAYRWHLLHFINLTRALNNFDRKPGELNQKR